MTNKDPNSRVSFCCPQHSEGTCDAYGHTWLRWLDADDPPGLGDIETITSFSEHAVCDEPKGVKVETISGDEPNDAFHRISIQEGFTCENDPDNTCDDFEVSFCCPKWGAGDLHCNTKVNIFLCSKYNSQLKKIRLYGIVYTCSC